MLLAEEARAVYWTSDSPDGDFDGASAENAEASVEAYRAMVELTRGNAAAWEDLDVAVMGRRRGEELNLRWILTHLIEEYARHLGHMDILREAIDGRTGY